MRTKCNIVIFSTRYLIKETSGALKAASFPQVTVCQSVASKKNLPPDTKVTGEPQRTAAARSQKHLPAPETKTQANGLFFSFFFSSSLPSSSRRSLTTSFPCDGVTFHSNITACLCQCSSERSVSYSFLRYRGMWPLHLCCVSS